MNPRWITSITALAVLWTGLLACDYGRMNDQEALQTYKTQLPEMGEGAIPVTGGLQALKEMGPDNLRNPLPSAQEALNRGGKDYGYYCVMCHGPNADGIGTVGQSFYPLPTNLKSPYVQGQSDGKIFYTITFGFKRHPGLGFMISEMDRWAIVHYLRSLPKLSKLSELSKLS